MNEEILSRLERIDHKEYSNGFEFADSSTFDEMARCFEERKILAKEIVRLNKVLKYLENYFSNREDYELSQIVRDTKQANIEWLDKAIDRFKGIDLTDKDKRQIRGLKEEFKIGDKE